MKGRSARTVLSTISIAILVLWPMIMISSWQADEGTSQLELRISLQKSQFVLGEPVDVKFRLLNEGSQDVAGDFYLTFDFDRLGLHVSRDNGPFEPYLSKAMEIAALKKQVQPPVLLGAGDSLESSQLVSYNTLTSDFAFPEAGRYAMKATLIFNHYEDTIESNSVEIIVVEPTGQDRDALAFIRANSIEIFLTPERRLFPESLDENITERVEEFMVRFPDSLYASFMEGEPPTPPVSPPPFPFLLTIILSVLTGTAALVAFRISKRRVKADREATNATSATRQP